MKSKISLFNKAVWKRNLTGYSGFWAGLLVLMLLFLPLNVYGGFASLQQSSDVSPGMDELVYVMISVLWRMDLFVPLYALAALLAAMFVFSYLFNSRSSNMMHTFPVSRMSLFVTNYVSGLLFLVVPQLAAAFLSLVIGAVNGAVNGAVMKSYLAWIGVMSIENLFFFSAAVCMLMFVGNIVAVPVLYFILNFLYQGCMLILNTIVSTVCYGLGSLDAGIRSFGVLTPIIYMRRISITDNGAVDSFAYPIGRTEVLPGYFAAAVLFTAIAVAAYRKKHVETAGDVITVGWLKPVFRWGTAVCTSALGALFLSSILSGGSFPFILACALVIGIIVFFLAQMLLERTVHVFTQKRVRECILYSAVVCALYVSLDADLYGIERKMPDQAEIEAVIVNGGIELYAQNEEETAWAQALHRQLIDSKKEFENAGGQLDEVYNYVTIRYLLKGGGQLVRSYWVPESREAGSVPEVIRAYASQPEVILKKYFGIHYPDIKIFGGTLSCFDQAGNPGEDVRISQADAGKLYEAMIKDVAEGNFVRDEAEENNMQEEAVTAGPEEWGYLRFDIRDEKGYRSTSDYYSTVPIKDAQTEIWLLPEYTNLNQAAHELGYISDELYEKISNQ